MSKPINSTMGCIPSAPAITGSKNNKTDELVTSRPSSPTTCEHEHNHPHKRGLKNLGNTCYLNSALQMLFSLQNGFIEDLLNSSIQDKNLNDSLVRVGKDIQRREVHSAVVDPTPIKEAVDEVTSRFVGYRQQDSHEFLMALLDLLHEELIKKSAVENEETISTDDIVPTVQNVVMEDEEMSGKRKRSVPLRELDHDDISHLLHGDSHNEGTNDKKMVQASDWKAIEVVAHNMCTLVGGRSAVANAKQDSVRIITSPSKPPPPEETKIPDMKKIQLEPISSDQINATSETLETISEESESQNDISVPTEHTQGIKHSDNNEKGEIQSTLVDDHFTAEVSVTLTCDSCSYTRSKIETHRHLSLEVTIESPTVEEGLRQFFEPEKRELKCEKCFCETATQSMEFTKLPTSLLLHLKRFIVEMNPPHYYVTFSKNQAKVEFLKTFDLADYCSDNVVIPNRQPQLRKEIQKDIREAEIQEDIREAANDSIFISENAVNPFPSRCFKLRSTVAHLGSTASCGHYTADALTPDHGWMRFNDQVVTSITEDEAIGSSSQEKVYMLLYEFNP